MDIFEGLIDRKMHSVISVFLKFPEEYFHINKVAERSSVPVATTFRIINQLNDLGIIEATNISKFRIYRLADNKKTKKLRRLL